MKTVEFDNPVFFDKKVQDLNTELESLGWIQAQYPICWKGEVEEGTFPEAYYGAGKKNFKVLPEGRSLSFFTIDGDINEIEDFDYEVPLSLFVWCDLLKVYPQKLYDYTGELIKDVIGILKANSCNDLIIKTDKVFDEYSLIQKQLQQNTMKPYTAFKISFKTLLTKC